MQKHLLLFLIFFCCLTKGFSQTHVSGNIQSNTTWTKANSPYILDGTVGVPSAYKLTIEPGVTVQRTANNQILVNGAISFNGSATDSITFVSGGAVTATDPFITPTLITRYYFIEFQKSNLSASSIRFVSFHNQSGNAENIRISNGLEYQQTIKNSGNLLISRSNLNQGYTSAYGYLSDCNLNIDSCLIANANIFGYVNGEKINVSNSKIYNSTINSDRYNAGINFTNTYLKNSNLLFGCCGGNLSFSNSKLEDSKFTDGLGEAPSGQVSISYTTLLNTTIYDQYAQYNINNSQIVITKNPLNLTGSQTGYIINVGNLNLTSSQIINLTAYNYNGALLSGKNGDYVGSSSNISNNLFSNLYDAAVITNISSITFNNNNFKNIARYQIANQSTKDFTASNNYFDLKPGKTINDVILDNNDNLNYGLVTYSPNSNNLNTNAPVSSPKNVYKQAQNGNVAVVWSRNKEANIKNYKVYWGYVDAFTYAHSSTVAAADSTYIINGASTTDSIAVTALNTNATGANDQLNGFESWYSSAGPSPIPTLTSFTPTIGAQGTQITLTGINFTGITSVSFGTVPAQSFSIVSPTTITAIPGDGASGSVAVSTLGGISSISGFTYIPPPAPAISYSNNSLTYYVGQSINPVSPVNTGGNVPAARYAQVSTFAGTRGTTGSANGNGTAATFNYPSGLALDAAGNVYVAERDNHLIRKITPAGVVSTFAGSGVAGSTNGMGTAASFNNPTAIVADAGDNLYVVDRANNLIRKITPAGVVSTFAGSGTQASVNGTGTGASFAFPTGIGIDAAGNLYVSEIIGNRIRKISPAGVVTTFAGNGTQGNIDGPAATANFNNPYGIAVDANGNVFVADAFNDDIRKITPDGTVSTVAGNGHANTVDVDGTGTAAAFQNPSAIAIDGMGNMYVTESGMAIRMVTPAGVVTTLAGNVLTAYHDGIGATATFNQPTGIAIDPKGTLFVADRNNQVIRKIAITGYTISPALPKGLTFDTATGTISGTPAVNTNAVKYSITADNLAGQNTAALSITIKNVAPPVINYKSPQTYTVNTAINPLSPANSGGAVPANIYGQATTIAGSGAQASTNGTGTAASFNFPAGLVTYGSDLFVADANSNAIRKVSSTGVVTTLAGSNNIGYVNSTGTSASFSYPTGITVDQAGNLYVADQNNQVIRKVTQAGVVSTFAGTHYEGHTDGAGTVAAFSYPTAIVANAQGNLFVTEEGSSEVRKITPDGVVSTFAGNGVKALVNGTGTNASFFKPQGITIDVFGNLYVADWGNYAIRKITPDGVVTTLAGSGTSGTADGQGAAASFTGPMNIATDQSGNLYVTDQSSQGSRIRMVTQSGVVTTLAGKNVATSTDGIGTAASFYYPWGITINDTGDLYISDRSSNKIRKLAITGYSVRPALPVGLTMGTDGTITGTPTQVTPAADYTVIAYNTGGNGSARVNITVNKITPVLTFPALANPIYGDADVTLNVTSNNSATPINYTIDNPNIAIVTNGKLHIAAAGTVNITVAQAEDALHNSAIPITRTVIINPRTILVAAFPSSKIYGNADSTLKYEILRDGSLVGKDAFTGMISREPGENAGEYKITQGTLALSNNYVLNFIGNVLFIDKKSLTVTANNATWNYGKSTSLAVTYSGFVNGDDAGKLTTQPKVTTTANASAPVAGTYDLVPGGGVSANYSFNYVNGKLTVTLPATNFKISGTSVTCKGSNNGIITITPTASLKYTAVVTGGSINQTYHFNSTLTISSLAPATYHICVSADNLPDNQQCSDLTITEPEDLAVYATVNKTVNTVTLALTGSDNYTVKVNGTEYQISSNSITLPLNKGSNKISVNTDKLCQGSFEQMIDLSGITAPYPSPFQSVLYVNLGEHISAVATISIFNMTDGRQVLSQKFNNQSGVVRLDVAALRTGVYTLNLTLDGKLSTFKIVKQ